MAESTVPARFPGQLPFSSLRFFILAGANLAALGPVWDSLQAVVAHPEGERMSFREARREAFEELHTAVDSLDHDGPDLCERILTCLWTAEMFSDPTTFELVRDEIEMAR